MGREERGETTVGVELGEGERVARVGRDRAWLARRRRVRTPAMVRDEEGEGRGRGAWAVPRVRERERWKGWRGVGRRLGQLA